MADTVTYAPQSPRTVQVTQSEARVPMPEVNPVLIDGTLAMVIISSMAGLIRLVLPGIGKVVDNGQTARIAAEAEARKVDLDIERNTAETMRKLLEAFSTASVSANSSMTEVLVSRVSETLDNVSVSLATLVEQSNRMADTQNVITQTQQSIAETQQRTIAILCQIEIELKGKGDGKLHLPIRKLL